MPSRKLVIGSRTALVMLFVAAVALLGLGIVAAVRTDAPETDGWLRALFGRVFSIAAVGLAAVLGIPAAAGLWAMSGATAEDAVPALPPGVRRVLVGIAVAATLVVAVDVILTGGSVLALNLGLIALVALSTLGLAGATAFSPHRGRAWLSTVALLLVVAGTAWILVQTAGLRAT